MKFSKKQDGPFALIKSALSLVKSLLDRETKSFDIEPLFQVDQKDFLHMLRVVLSYPYHMGLLVS